MASNERNASGSLKTLGTAQADFRSNDRDENGKNDFWRGDVAGLYTLLYQGQEMKLIEITIAAADSAPLAGNKVKMRERSPKANYWYRALRFADEKKPDPNRFAFMTYPADFEHNHEVYILSHENTMYHKRFESAESLPTVYPADPIAEGWSLRD